MRSSQLPKRKSDTERRRERRVRMAQAIAVRPPVPARRLKGAGHPQASPAASRFLVDHYALHPDSCETTESYCAARFEGHPEPVACTCSTCAGGAHA